MQYSILQHVNNKNRSCYHGSGLTRYQTIAMIQFSITKCPLCNTEVHDTEVTIRSSPVYWSFSGSDGKLPAMQETRVQSLHWEGTPGEGNGSPLQFLSWRIPRTEEPDALQSMGSQRVGHSWSNLALCHIEVHGTDVAIRISPVLYPLKTFMFS